MKNPDTRVSDRRRDLDRAARFALRLHRLQRLASRDYRMPTLEEAIAHAEARVELQAQRYVEAVDDALEAKAHASAR